jgi:hypothetical protein
MQEPLKINIKSEYENAGSMEIGSDIHYCLERHTVYNEGC